VAVGRLHGRRLTSGSGCDRQKILKQIADVEIIGYVKRIQI
jgi:hypothetical protein